MNAAMSASHYRQAGATACCTSRRIFMCDACITNSIKVDMERREFLAAAALGAVVRPTHPATSSAA
jgi:hypothetical protein